MAETEKGIKLDTVAGTLRTYNNLLQVTGGEAWA